MTATGQPGPVRWPLEPLVAVCPVPSRTRQDPFSTAADRPPLDPCARLARWLGLDLGHVRQAAAEGLSDVQADRWAVRGGWHPAAIWGWDAWAAAGLDVHRVAHLVPDALRIAADITATGKRLRKAAVLAELRAQGVVLGTRRGIALWQGIQAALADAEPGGEVAAA